MPRPLGCLLTALRVRPFNGPADTVNGTACCVQADFGGGSLGGRIMPPLADRSTADLTTFRETVFNSARPNSARALPRRR
jgi:hypothetical protein